jgi:hypothetical protein
VQLFTAGRPSQGAGGRGGGEEAGRRWEKLVWPIHAIAPTDLKQLHRPKGAKVHPEEDANVLLAQGLQRCGGPDWSMLAPNPACDPPWLPARAGWRGRGRREEATDRCSRGRSAPGQARRQMHTVYPFLGPTAGHATAERARQRTGSPSGRFRGWALPRVCSRSTSASAVTVSVFRPVRNRGSGSQSPERSPRGPCPSLPGAPGPTAPHETGCALGSSSRYWR